MFDQGNQIPSNFTISFSRITLRGSGVSIDAGGSIQVSTTVFSNRETTFSNLITLNNLTDVMTKADNLRFDTTYDNVLSPTLIVSMEISGRIFDSVHGFVDVATLQPLTFATLTQLFPDSGRIRLAGNASAIEIEAISSTRVRLFPDLNNDGAADNTAFMNWTDLSGPVGANIADTDGDGMHNSWETVNNAFNAGADLDGDGFDNFTEYQNGTNPNVFNP
jgi:hypothetical protein